MMILFRLLLVLTLVSGCGYSQKASIPRNIQTLYVETITNEIPPEKIYAYHPGLEILATNAIIRRFQRDGNLKIVSREEADATLEAKLIEFEQSGLRFTNLERVEEYRLYLTLATRLIDNHTGEVIWEESNFSGDTDFFISDVRSVSREEAVQRVVERLARNVVDRVVEDW